MPSAMEDLAASYRRHNEDTQTAAILRRLESLTANRVEVPDFAHRLPEPLRPFTTQGVYDLDEQQHLSFTQGAGHGGRWSSSSAISSPLGP